MARIVSTANYLLIQAIGAPSPFAVVEGATVLIFLAVKKCRLLGSQIPAGDRLPGSPMMSQERFAPWKRLLAGFCGTFGHAIAIFIPCFTEWPGSYPPQTIS